MAHTTERLKVPLSRTTRSSAEKEQIRVKMVFDDFIAATDLLIRYESKINVASTSTAVPSGTVPTLHTLQIRLDHLESLWVDAKGEYKLCARALRSDEYNADVKAVLAKYERCYEVYERCGAELRVQIEQTSFATRPAEQAPAWTSAPVGVRLPACDTEIFCGDYLKWPTFRDLITAIYVKNSRLTPVEKLYHL